MLFSVRFEMVVTLATTAEEEGVAVEVAGGVLTPPRGAGYLLLVVVAEDVEVCKLVAEVVVQVEEAASQVTIFRE